MLEKKANFVDYICGISPRQRQKNKIYFIPQNYPSLKEEETLRSLKS